MLLLADTTGVCALFVHGSATVRLLGLPTDKASGVARLDACVWCIGFEIFGGVIAVGLRNILPGRIWELGEKV